MPDPCTPPHTAVLTLSLSACQNRVNGTGAPCTGPDPLFLVLSLCLSVCLRSQLLAWCALRDSRDVCGPKASTATIFNPSFRNDETRSMLA